MKKTINYLIICVILLTSVVFGQGITNNHNDNFAEKVVAFANILTTVEKQLGVVRRPEIDTFLQALPITPDSIDERIKQLDKLTTVDGKLLAVAQQYAERLQQTNNELKQQQIQLDALAAVVKTLEKDKQTLEQLLGNPFSKAELSAEEQQRLSQLLATAKQVITAYAQQRQTLRADDQRLQQAVDSNSRWLDALSEHLVTENNRQVETTQSQLLAKQHKLEKQADSLQAQLDKNRSYLSNQQLLEAQINIRQLKTEAWLTEQEMSLAIVMSQSQHLDSVNETLSLAELNEKLQMSNQRLDALETLHQKLSERLVQIKKQDELTGQFDTLIKKVEDLQKIVAYQQNDQARTPAKISSILLKKNQSELFTRHAWLSADTWQQAQTGFLESVLQITYQIKISAQSLWEKVQERPVFSGLFATLSALITWGLLGFVARLQRERLESPAYDRWILSTLLKILNALGKLRYWLMATVFVILLSLALKIASPSDDIIYLLASCFIATNVGQVLFMQEFSNKATPNRLILFGYISFIGLMVTIVFYGLSLFSLVDNDVLRLSEKVLMCLVMVFSVALYRIARYHTQGERHNSDKKWYDNYRKLLLAIPLLTAIAGLVNLLGYDNLAWLTLKYLGLFFLFWVALIIGLTAIIHLRKKAKMWSIKHLAHGTFIAQDVVSPIAFVLQLLWLYAAGNILFYLAEWNRDSFVITKFISLLETPLLTIGSTAITGKMLLLSVVALYLVIKGAKWLKRLAYQWLFAKISDLGIRSSLSIFAQYLFSLLGVIVTLNVLGINLTSLAVFAGALGVGIGLGLQDIAKNFISGILLLIERPLRTGDWVLLDEKEGLVKSIGLRAITIETFDKQEVIIPNGNAINNSFTNFTHSDTITRTIVYVGASYRCPPKKVLSVIADTIKQVSTVLKTPEPRLILWEYGDSSINYRIQYFIDTDKHHIMDVRTQLLTAIWYAFEAYDIEIPFPQQDVHFKGSLPIWLENSTRLTQAVNQQSDDKANHNGNDKQLMEKENDRK